MAERRGDRPLAARLDVEQRAARAARPLRRARARPAAVLRARRARARVSAGARARAVPARRAPRAPRARVRRGRAAAAQLGAQPFEQRLRAFASAAPVARARCAGGRASRSPPRARPAASASSSSARRRSSSSGVRAARRRACVRARQPCAGLAVFEPLAQAGEIELGDARPQRRDLAAELLGALGRGRLQRERPQPLLHLGLDVARALDLDRDARELELGAVLARA